MRLGNHRDRSTVRRAFCAAMTACLVLLSSSLAFADVISNDVAVDTGTGDKTRTITAGGSANVTYTISTTDPSDPVNGCNSTGADPATVTLSVPSGVTATPSSWSQTGCGDRVVGFTSSTPGTYTISISSVTGGKAGSTWNTTPATFKLIVQSAGPPPDSTPPVVTVPSNITTEATGPSGAAASFSASANDNVDGPLTPTCVPASGSTFALGTTTVTCSATDTAGNTGSASFSVTVVDTTAPSVTVPADMTVEATGPSGAVATFSASASDAVSGSLTPSCSPASGSTFGLGATTVTCSATDGAGNTGSSSFTVTVVDTTAPDVTAPADVTVEATGPSGAAVTYSGATASDLVDGSLTPTCSPASGSTFPIGTSTVTCSATDDAGNTGYAFFDVTVEDTTAPLVTAPADITVEATGPTGAVVTYSGATAEDTVDGTLTPVCTPASGSTFSLGTHIVTCEATDTAGNTGQDTFSITVEDTTPPEVTPPADITVEATGPLGAVVSYPDATAVDVVDGAVPASCSPPSGSTFSLGTTTVTCSATDDAGNTGSATFSITVEDTTPPDVYVPADITAEATGPGGAVVSYPAATASDIVDGPLTPSCSPASGSTFSLGTHIVTCEATDNAGNTGSATFSITVEDTTPPEVTVPANMIVEATGPSGATVSFSATAEDLVDGSLTPSCSPASGSTFSLGTTVVTCSATDDAGNTGSASFDVSVVDTTAPDVTVPANITVYASSASGAAVSFSASASDIVDGPITPTCSPASGATFAPGTTTVTCSATDTAGNTGSASFSVTVLFNYGGFYAPIDKGIHNTVKGGATVPLKFTVWAAGGGYIRDVAIVAFKTATIPCDSTLSQDEVEMTTSGATQLRYDTSAEQFIQNWQTPKKPGTCARATITLVGGQKISADFRLK